MDPAATLTDRQQAIHQFIRDWTAAKGYPPTLDEIQGEFRFRSKAATLHHLDALEKKGLLRRERFKSRCLRALDPGESLVVRGRVNEDRGSRRRRALGIGSPARLAFVEPEWFGGAGTFALRACGDFDAREGVADGDCLIVRPIAASGQGDRDADVRRRGDERGPLHLVRDLDRGGAVFLQRGDPDRIVDQSRTRLEIVGRVVGLVRRLPEPEEDGGD